ncbi:MAG TPA: rhodanese-like domain-containing protein [Roseivirga sp.]
MFKKKIILVTLGVLLFISASVIYVKQKGLYTFLGAGSVQRIETVEAAELITEKDLVILDARTIEEFETSHLKNSLRFEESLLSSLNKEQPILIYCTVGVRSNRVAKALSDAGYKEVYDMKDGILGWANQEYPLIDNFGELTNQIHTYNKSFAPLLKKGTAVY